jgi:16S rRNA (guanine966-N2)-methyltransferase
LRIIGGQNAGFIIKPPKNIDARPTTDMAKEALFNILNNRFNFENLQVLDLFGGAGNICFEFASRQVQAITTVDISPITFNFLQEVKAKLKLDNLVPIKGDALKYLQHCTQTFDVIFADPPYAMQNIDTIREVVFERQLIKPGGTLIIEHNRNVRLGTQNFTEARKYGQSCFSFFAPAGQ